MNLCIYSFLHESLFCMKGWTEWHLQTVQWQYGPPAMLRIAVVHSHCYQTSVNVGQHTVLLFLPVAFISTGETSTKHAVHTSGLSGSAHSRCRVNLWRGPDVITPWFLFFLYRLYMQNGCWSSLVNSMLYGFTVQLRQCWPQTFVLERHI